MAFDLAGLFWRCCGFRLACLLDSDTVQEANLDKWTIVAETSLAKQPERYDIDPGSLGFFDGSIRIEIPGFIKTSMSGVICSQ